jgi:hypothetical protein
MTTGTIWQAGWIAPAARSWLQTTRQGRILHLFAHTGNLVNEAGRLLTLAQAEVGPGPFALTLSPSPAVSCWARLTADCPVVVDGDRLWLGSIQIDTVSACLWSPQPDWASLRSSRCWTHLYRSLWQHIAADSTMEQGMVARMAQPLSHHLHQLIQAIQAADVPLVASAAGQLAGLGPGLTPAGDDMLMGVLYGLWATYPAERAQALAQVIAAAAAAKTTTLSTAWLQAAAVGEAAAAWHDLVRALAEGRETAVIQATQRILQTGHTSGYDALTGFVAAIAQI